MGFKLYRYEAVENLSETYRDPERMVLSGWSGPIAAYVKSVKLAEWDLKEIELAALVKPGSDIATAAVLCEVGSDQPGHLTIYRLVSIHGKSSDDTTEMVAHFKLLVNNLPVDNVELYRRAFTVPASNSRPDIYENLKLSGGTRSGTWKWMEIEQILTATVMSPTGK